MKSQNVLKPTSDEFYMRLALDEAKKAFEKDEVPVGAVLVFNGRVIAKGHNLTQQLTDFTAHAEMQVFTSATEYLGHKYLNECTLYVTLEPCVMCAGASFWTRVGRIIFGASDDRRGFLRLSEKILHPVTKIKGGVLEEECGSLIKSFFKQKRV